MKIVNKVKRENNLIYQKRLLLILILFSIILFSYTIIISQTSPFPGSGSGTGSTGTGTQGGETPESQTKTGAENPPEQGEIGSKKQDLGGLVGLENKQGSSGTGGTGTTPTPSGTETPSLKGQDVDFKRDVDVNRGKQKVELTPDYNKPGEPNVELNGDRINIKEPEKGAGELGKGKVVIEKEDGEKFAETGAGTEYTIGQKDFGEELGDEFEGKTGNTVEDELAGRKVELSPDTKVKITEDESGKKQVDLNVPKGGEVNEPEERKNGEEEEKKETTFRWSGQNLKWNSGGETHNLDGEILWNQKQGFYTDDKLKSSPNLNVDGIEVYSNDGKPVQVTAGEKKDGEEEKEITGPYAHFGYDSFSSGSKNENPGPLLTSVTSENPYGTKSVFNIQAGGNSEVQYTVGNAQGTKEGQISVLGESAKIEIGDKLLRRNGNNLYVQKTQYDIMGYDQQKTGVSFYDSNGNPSRMTGDINVNGEQYLKFNENNGYAVATRPTDIKPRVQYNELTPTPFVSPTTNLASNYRMSVNSKGIALGYTENRDFIFIGQPSKNFPNLPRNIMDTAITAKRNIANEWLGEEIPNSQGKVHINLNTETNIEKGVVNGLTWPKYLKDRDEVHSIFLSGDPKQNNFEEKMLATTTHEMAHAVLHTKYSPVDGKALESWVHEGIASRYDYPQDIKYRDNYLIGWANGQLQSPRYQDKLFQRRFPSSDDTAYAMATSTVDYLLSQNPNKQNFINAADYARDHNWDRALQKYYNIRNTGELERQWRMYIIEKYGGRQMDPNF